MLNIKWRVKGLIEYLHFQEKVLKAKVFSRMKYMGEASPVCFIAGCGRSGTTFLGRILSMHPGIAYLEEPRNYWIAINKKTDVWGYCSGTDANSSLIIDKTPTQLEKMYFANLFYRYSASKGSRILVEKTPENVFRTTWLSQLNDVKLIHIIRNGEDVVRSIVREADRLIPYGIKDMDNWYGSQFIKIKTIENTARALGISDEVIAMCKSSIEWGALEWICSMKAMQKNYNVFPSEKQIVIKYEDILSKPWDNYKKLLHFLGIDVDESLRESIEQYVSPRGHKKMPVNLFGPVKNLFEKELEKAGYA